jgi:hypothetical protein
VERKQKRKSQIHVHLFFTHGQSLLYLVIIKNWMRSYYRPLRHWQLASRRVLLANNNNIYNLNPLNTGHKYFHLYDLTCCHGNRKDFYIMLLDDHRKDRYTAVFIVQQFSVSQTVARGPLRLVKTLTIVMSEKYRGQINSPLYIGFEVLTAAIIRSAIVWDVTPCGLVVHL